MSSLEFNLNCRDQASAVVASVQRKIADFGKDIGKTIVGMIGPMAAVQWGIGKISQYFEDMARKAKEAFDWGAGLSDSAKQLGVTAEEFQGITEAATRTGDSVENVGKAFKLARDLIDQARAGSTNAAESITALGLDINQLDKMKPADVLKALAGAMEATVDPAQRAQIAVAALGKEAVGLQKTLAKGFDIGGALESTIGLTEIEVEFLRMERERLAGEANKERLKSAKQQAAQKFLEQGGTEAEAIKAEFIRQGIARGATRTGAITSATPGFMATFPEVQQAVIDVLKRRKDEKDAAEAAARAAAAAAPASKSARDALTEKAKRDAEAEAKAKAAPEPKFRMEKAAPEAKPAGVTVSSLREIGGGLAGEQATFADVAFQSLGEQKAMNETLRRIEAKLIPSPSQTDFTKNPLLGGVDQFTPGNFTPGPMTAASRVGVA